MASVVPMLSIPVMPASVITISTGRCAASLTATSSLPLKLLLRLSNPLQQPPSVFQRRRPRRPRKPLMMVGMLKKNPTKRSSVKKKRSSFIPATDDHLFHVKPRKRVPHEFVLEALADLEPRTNPMFGCLAVYVGEKIVMILRDKRDQTAADDGVWLATIKDHHESLRNEFPNMRSIAVFGKEVTGWQVLPADAPDFEQAALRACELVAAKDPRIGKIPQKKAKRTR